MTKDPAETRDLIHRAQAGDARAAQDLLLRYGDRLLGRIRLMMGDGARRVADSGDFLQSVFVDVIEGLERFEVRDDEAFLRWATQIARNRIRDRVRRKRERAFESLASNELPDVEGGARSPPSEAALDESAHRLAEAMEKLSPDHRRVIELRDLEGLSYREIAQRMSRPSEEAVQMLRARALAKLTRILG